MRICTCSFFRSYCFIPTTKDRIGPNVISIVRRFLHDFWCSLPPFLFKNGSNDKLDIVSMIMIVNCSSFFSVISKSSGNFFDLLQKQGRRQTERSGRGRGGRGLLDREGVRGRCSLVVRVEEIFFSCFCIDFNYK